MNNKSIYTAVIVGSLYIAAQLLSDISSLRILMIAGFSVDGGTLIYPLTFTLRDMIHKTIDKRAAQMMIFLAAGINLFMALLFWVVAHLPADMGIGSQDEFGALLAPVYRIVIASIIAEVISELIDTEAYQMWVNKVGQSKQWGRVLMSNAVSVPIDSALFCVIAFWGDLPSDIILSIFIANIVVKGLMSVASIPMIYMVKDNGS